jgi:hydroxymethylglutaryl-CoA lyase
VVDVPPAQRFVHVRDVTLRDGLQDEQPVPTPDKVALYESLVAAGIRDLELTSFVRLDRIPALADAEDLVRLTAGSDDVTRWGLVLNLRGAIRAIDAGLNHLQFVVSVSEAHQLENAGRSVSESLDALSEIVDAAQDHDAVVEATLATAFGCPFQGPVPPADVLKVLEQVLERGVKSVSLADTIGVAVPTEVAALVSQVREVSPDMPLGAHLHDTRGLGIVNALSALEAGADRIDGTVGGLGGCPFAPGASGNLPLEDLVHALHAMGVSTGIDLDRLLDAATLACSLVGQPVSSHVGVAGPRFSKLAR